MALRKHKVGTKVRFADADSSEANDHGTVVGYIGNGVGVMRVAWTLAGETYSEDPDDPRISEGGAG